MSEDWGELSPLRIGRATASRIKDIVAATRTGGYRATRSNYAAELVAERLTEVQYFSSFESAAMKWGKDHEPLARMSYELQTGFTVENGGFVIHPTIAMAGASPDGLVNNDGLVEIKCPNTATHIATLRGEPIDNGYLVQMQWQMACTKRLWCDWVSYDPRLPEEMRLFVQRIPRDNKRIAELEEEVELFLHEVEATVTYLRHKYQEAATFEEAQRGRPKELGPPTTEEREAWEKDRRDRHGAEEKCG